MKLKNSVFLSWLSFLDIIYFCTSDGSFRILKKKGLQTFIPAVLVRVNFSGLIVSIFVFYFKFESNSIELSSLSPFQLLLVLAGPGEKRGNYGWFKNSRIDTPGEGGCQLPRRVQGRRKN